MRTSQVIVIIALLLIASSSRPAHAEGREVEITMTDGRVIGGELLSVRDGSFVISMVSGLQDDELRQHPEYILDLPLHDVSILKIDGSSNALLGMSLGLLAGAAGGAAIGNALSKSSDNGPRGWDWDFSGIFGGIIGGVVGVVGGAAVGSGISGEGEVFDAASLRDIRNIRRYARYDEGEPEFLTGLLR